MKKLVLGSLFLAAVATQATGCIISDGGEEDAIVTAQWSFSDVNNTGGLAATGCPVGFSAIHLVNQELDSADRPIGEPWVDIFDCGDTRHDSAPLPPAVYETWIEVRNGQNGPLYAESLSAFVDVRDVDKTFNANIVNNGGYFKLAWDFRDAQNRAINCLDTPEIDGVAIDATLAGPNTLVSDEFVCEDGFNFTDALIQGSYEVKVTAINQAGQALSNPVTKNALMNDRNEVTDLGAVTFIILD